jgi:hypothetical protein
MVIQIRTNKVLNDLEFYEPNSACHPSTQFDQINQESINSPSLMETTKLQNVQWPHNMN